MWRSLPLSSNIRFKRSLSVTGIPYLESLSYSTSVNRFARDFLERGHARGRFDQPRAAQCDHPVFNRFLLQFRCRRTHQDQFADVVVYFHDFVKTGAALITGAVANRATAPLEHIDLL